MRGILPALAARVFGYSFGLAVLVLALVRCSSSAAPPLPGEPKANVTPLTLAKTKPVACERLSDDERYRLETKCQSEGRIPESTDLWVACNAPGRLGWFEGVADVAPRERGVSP